MDIILGSNSPRRKELLRQIGYQFTVVSPDIDENIDGVNLVDMVEKISLEKAKSLQTKYYGNLIICADTIVVVNDQHLGKPINKDDAFRMIKMLQNNVHQVYTAVTVVYLDNVYKFCVQTDVYVNDMDDEEILEYISTDEPYDKAGGYGIQGVFAKHIDRIDGDYYNVMGLPISRLDKLIKQIKKSHI